MSTTAPSNWSQKGQQQVWQRETASGTEKISISDNNGMGSGWSVFVRENGDLRKLDDFRFIDEAKKCVQNYISNN